MRFEYVQKSADVNEDSYPDNWVSRVDLALKPLWWRFGDIKTNIVSAIGLMLSPIYTIVLGYRPSTHWYSLWSYDTHMTLSGSEDVDGSGSGTGVHDTEVRGPWDTHHLVSTHLL